MQISEAEDKILDQIFELTNKTDEMTDEDKAKVKELAKGLPAEIRSELNEGAFLQGYTV